MIHRTITWIRILDNLNDIQKDMAQVLPQNTKKKKRNYQYSKISQLIFMKIRSVLPNIFRKEKYCIVRNNKPKTPLQISFLNIT